MHVFIVYAHPSCNSLTAEVLHAFREGLFLAQHTYELSDLYAMNFKTDISEEEYLREAFYRGDPVADDVRREQEKIQRADAIVFIYPLFWTEAPAKLVGWFDRVWSYGFAYGKREMKTLQKALFLCVAGNTVEQLIQMGRLDAMKNVMLSDRVADRAKHSELIVLGGTSREFMDLRDANRPLHLRTAFEAGNRIAQPRLSLRTATQRDRQAIYELHVAPLRAIPGAYKGEGPWDDDLSDIDGVYLNENGEFVLGELDGEIVAMGAFKPACDGYAEIKRMRVAINRQGQGLGRQIYEHLEQAARQRGYKGFVLETSVHQAQAQAFYEAHGFSRECVEVIDGLECVWYRKTFSV